MTERTTSELIDNLANDVTLCHGSLVQSIDEGTTDEKGDVEADYEYHARMLIRAVFAFIEGVTFSVKVKAAELCLKSAIDITDAERFFADDVDYMITNVGEVIERPAHIRLSENVRFAFRLQEKALELSDHFNASVSWWSDFKSSIKVRDRLTHPKMPEDLDVSGDEIVKALKAYEGFKSQLEFYAEQRTDEPVANDA